MELVVFIQCTLCPGQGESYLPCNKGGQLLSCMDSEHTPKSTIATGYDTSFYLVTDIQAFFPPLGLVVRFLFGFISFVLRTQLGLFLISTTKAAMWTSQSSYRPLLQAPAVCVVRAGMNSPQSPSKFISLMYRVLDFSCVQCWLVPINNSHDALY